MRKLYSALFVLFFFAVTQAQAQELSLTPDRKKPTTNPKASMLVPGNAVRPVVPTTPGKCGFEYMMNKAKARGYDERAFEAEVARLMLKRQAEGLSFTGPVTLPIIFHVIYRTADALGTNSPNLATSKFTSQLAQLNKDFSNLSGSTIGAAADVQIRFCMAVVDTAGRPLATPGIDRVNAQTRGWSVTSTMDEATLEDYLDATIKPGTIWDPYSYVNVWTVAADASQLLGYSTFPNLSTLADLFSTETSTTAGSVIAWQSVGSVTDPGVTGAPYNLGRTLSHELGHYFGLRHIWGDDLCGDDFCADTPPQDDATIGCPAAGTLNNCVPSGPKMFQNYMDYTDDACVNTFTANQATRSQTVMDNSPRRLTVINSKACTARPGNSIQFATAAPINVLETAPAGACPNTRSYSFNIYVSTQATAAATVTFSLSGTALQNRDYTISPASVSYVLNDNAIKTVTVTVIDDQAVEPTETIILGYTITGTGVIAAPDKQTLTISIFNDDAANISVDNTAPTKTLLSQDFNASTNIPAGWATQIYGDGVTTPNQWVVSPNGGAGTVVNSAHITSNTTTKPNSYNVSNISDAYLFTPLIDATGLKNLNLTFKWHSNGEVGYDEGYIGYIPEGQAVTAANVLYFNVALSGQSPTITSSLNFGSGFNGTKFYFVFNWFNDNTLGTDPPFTIDDVVFTGKAFTVATTVDADTAYSQYNGQNVQYASTNTVAPFDSRIIATVNNLTADVGCITASVQNAGGGTSNISLYTTSGIQTRLRANKVIKLTPAVANSTATYQLTLYYTTAEITAMGVPASQLRILKVTDGVSLASTIGTANATQYTPVVDDQTATKGYASFTINATGGFSQFVLYNGNGLVIPVNLLSFEAMPSGKSILLKWSTATELNNKGFVIERSLNGTDFERIGWMDGKINSDRQTNYTYRDNFVQPNVVYYYRLRQTDMDNREKLSDIKNARITGSSIVVTVSPNPAKDQLKLFISGSTGSADVNLVNAEGQLVRTWKKINTVSAPATLDISGVAAGVYMLQVINPEYQTVEKLIIK